SPKGLSDRVIPIGTFPSAILALEYLYGTYQQKNMVFNHLIYSNKRLTFFITAAFDKDYKLCGYDGQIRNIGLTLDPRTDVEREAKNKYDIADQGNVISYFVPLLPSIHCPHVGPTGGGACTDKTIDFYYNQTNFLACAHKQ
ncbi:unnamed protein product, partial [Rotaria sp. Silwood1]